MAGSGIYEHEVREGKRIKLVKNEWDCGTGRDDNPRRRVEQGNTKQQ